MMECRCQAVFNEYVHKEYERGAPEIVDKLLSAFEAGTLAAKRKGDASQCNFSALTNAEEFLAWFEGFKCCDGKRRK